MNEIRVASMALAVYFVSSAETLSMNSILSFVIMKGRYSSVMRSRARALSTPMITRSGVMKSLTAWPSLRNSGFETISNGISTPRACNSSLMALPTPAVVPTGTVDLTMITV